MLKKIGISPFGHDSTLAWFDEKNKSIHATTLERTTRHKHDFRFITPLLENAAGQIGNETNVEISLMEVSEGKVRYYDLAHSLNILEQKKKNFFKKADRLPFKILKILSKSPAFLPYYILKRSMCRLRMKIIRRSLGSNIPSFTSFLSKNFKINPDKIRYHDHHLSHAASAYYFAPHNFKNNCLVVTLDGQGDDKFSTVYKAESSGKMTKIAESSNAASIPMLYSIVTTVLGFRASSDEGKIEALACYGKAKTNDLYRNLEKAFSSNDNLEITLNPHEGFPFSHVSKQYMEILSYISGFSKKMRPEDLAADMQIFFENFFLDYFKKLRSKFPDMSNVAVSGGGFANVKLNLRIFEEKVFENFYIFPAMGDEGTSLGALALSSAASNEPIEWLRDFNMPYFGESFPREKVEETLEENKDRIKYEYLGEKTAKVLAEKIVANKICALFQGKMEFGPRALGNRSILANPRNPKMRDLVNLKFKKREWFQPFCPSILESEREKLFVDSYPNKHMTCAFRVKPEFKDKLPAIMHIDGTARPQFIEEKDNPLYFKLLQELKKINGYGAVLNTSFNIHGKAIVMTPEHALQDFFNCQIDCLFIEGFIVTRK